MDPLKEVFLQGLYSHFIWSTVPLLRELFFYGKVLRYQNARFIDLFVTDSIHLLTQYLI